MHNCQTDILKSIMSNVIKIVNLVRNSSLNRRKLQYFIDEMEGRNLIYFVKVHWLSRGRVRTRFVELLEPIYNFLTEKKLISLGNMI